MATFGVIRTTTKAILLQNQEISPLKLQFIGNFGLIGFVLFAYMASIEVRYFIMRLFQITEWSSWVVLRIVAQFLYNFVFNRVIKEFVRKYIECQTVMVR
jgi:hypothetical protein